MREFDMIREAIRNGTTPEDFARLLTLIEDGIEARYTLLPVDADDELIHVGDSVEIIGGEYGTVVAIELCENGGWNVSMRPAGWDTPTLFAAESVRHYKPQTVEDVLREFAEEWSDSKTRFVEDVLLAEYAAKLRLAGEDE